MGLFPEQGCASDIPIRMHVALLGDGREGGKASSAVVAAHGAAECRWRSHDEFAMVSVWLAGAGT